MNKTFGKLTNCFIVPREGEDTLFVNYEHQGCSFLVCNLDGFALIPLEALPEDLVMGEQVVTVTETDGLNTSVVGCHIEHGEYWVDKTELPKDV